MSAIAIGILVVLRVLFSSIANVFQKQLVERLGNARIVVTSSLLIVSILASPGLLTMPWDKLSWTFWLSCIAAALMDVPGNVLLVGSLGKSDLSLVGPLNSLKPVVGMLLGILVLHEFPSILGLVGVGILAAGTWSLAATADGNSGQRGVRWLFSLPRRLPYASSRQFKSLDLGPPSQSGRGCALCCHCYGFAQLSAPALLNRCSAASIGAALCWA
jgi:uncharacterized membrane protein